MGRMWSAAIAAAMVLALAGCGDDDGGGDGVATLGGAGSAGEPGAEGDTPAEVDEEEAQLAFARCMREHGVDMPDPEDGRVVVRAGSDGADPATVEAAHAACNDLLEAAFGDRPQPSPEEVAELRDRMVEFARCMRDHGVDVPDPTVDGGSIGIQVGDRGADPVDDATMEAAQEACQHLMGDTPVRVGRMGGDG